MRLLSYVEAKLDRITMYKTVLYGLLILTALAIGLGFAEVLPYSGPWQIASALVAVTVAFGANVIFARLFKVAGNHESAVITGLIMHFLILPAITLAGLYVVALGSVLAIASKYIIAYKKQHLLNPAATGAVLLVLLGIDIPLWWIGSPVLFVPMLIVGVLIVWKLRKWTPVLAFVGVGFLVYSVEALRFDLSPIAEAPAYFLSWPTLFLATVMLTEPFTMPPTKKLQAIYGGLVGFLSSTTLLSGFVSMSPELALVIGNIAMYPFTLRQKLIMPLIATRQIAADTFEFIFKKPTGLRFTAGQYLEWTLPHEATDSRGIRRYFTIASSPTEDTIALAAKVPAEHSTYKKALAALKPGDTIIASQLAGDFVLPKNTATKVGMIAGGIGVTPFRSQLQELADMESDRDVVLYYCNNTAADIAYQELFADIASKTNTKVVQVVSKESVPDCEKGYLTAEILKARTPDFTERTWYISGPPPMVHAYTELLRAQGVPKRQIVRDFFPGLA